MRHWQKHMSVTKPMLQREKREKEGQVAYRGNGGV